MIHYKILNAKLGLHISVNRNDFMRNTINTAQYNHDNRGMTMVELIVSMTLTAIFATAIVAVMSPASRVYMNIMELNRAQMVADIVIDSIREECADTYIEDFASARIVNTTPTADGDASLLSSLNGITSDSESKGNVLIIRKSGGFCEAIYSCIAISQSNYTNVKSNDYAYKYENGISSKAVYRLFDAGIATEEAKQGYLHYGYYQCGRATLEIGSEKINCIFPAVAYDYTNPFSRASYNGYTVDVSFSDITYAPEPGETTVTLTTKRPSSVMATVKVYKCDYASQSSNQPIYTREAILTFAEDTTKDIETT